MQFFDRRGAAGSHFVVVLQAVHQRGPRQGSLRETPRGAASLEPCRIRRKRDRRGGQRAGGRIGHTPGAGFFNQGRQIATLVQATGRAAAR